MKIVAQTILLCLFFAGMFTGCNRAKPAAQSRVKNSTNTITVALLPYKGFNISLLADVTKGIEVFYKCRVITLQVADLPSFAFYRPRQRYKADSLLVFQKQLVNSGIVSVAGFTKQDISTALGAIPDWGIFGLGYCPGKACIISTYRLQKASSNNALLKERLLKVVLHELGHNFGLPHCIANKECLMTDAGGTVKQVDGEKIWLCSHCKEILHQ